VEVTSGQLSENDEETAQTPGDIFRGPYKRCIGAHRHISAYRGASLHHMAADSGGNKAVFCIS